jgi:hypothetical protein
MITNSGSMERWIINGMMMVKEVIDDDVLILSGMYICTI